ncbi:MAG TPA: alternative ribosome rescue aminoacyl-tRNA hydrolase ArfB [Thermoanaerobaculia bacterium]|nr:alternative ribosome rescue aminoacyl-tRNA hydrolase ArfB [Thermoanaerobaculia bacterium]
MIEIAPGLAIADPEVRFATSRSSGPGGQNVNKVESRVMLLFDLAASPSLDEAQKGRIRERLAGRIGKDGVLRVTAQKHRTQGANREEAVARFAALLRAALAEEAPRRPTRLSAAAKRRRAESKRRRGELKRARRPPPPP